MEIKEDELGLLTQEQTASLLRVDKHTLAVWRVSGLHNLPFVKIGRSPFYRKSDILEWIARRVVTPGSGVEAR